MTCDICNGKELDCECYVAINIRDSNGFTMLCACGKTATRFSIDKRWCSDCKPLAMPTTFVYRPPRLNDDSPKAINATVLNDHWTCNGIH